MGGSQDLEVSAPFLRWLSERMALKWENATSSERIRQVSGLLLLYQSSPAECPSGSCGATIQLPPRKCGMSRRRTPLSSLLVAPAGAPRPSRPNPAALAFENVTHRYGDRSLSTGWTWTCPRAKWWPPGTERGREVDHHLALLGLVRPQERQHRGARLRPTSGRVCRPSRCHAPVRLGNRLAPWRPRRRGHPSRPAALQQSGAP